MNDEQQINIGKLRDWQKVAYIIFESEQSKAGMKQLCQDLHGNYKVLLNGREKVKTKDLDAAIAVYNTAFEKK